MEKLWKGRMQGALNDDAYDLNSSIKIDSVMFREDILGSIAHANMLGACGIITKAECATLVSELGKIKQELENGTLGIDFSAEDIHSFVEAELTKRLGDTGKKIHTARSRNDQVATDLKLYLRGKTQKIQSEISNLVRTLIVIAEEHIDTIMPGYTHLQRAQPITLAHHLLAYVSMFVRDYGRFTDCIARMNYCPLGSGALAGTTYTIDRKMTAKELGFTAPVPNSLDGVSDRDHCIELASTISILMMHLSRFGEEVIIWNTQEFGFIELSDAYSTGSSMMPQKKNPDIAELARSKAGRVFGNLSTLLAMMKALPLSYNKDMQEDKEAIFDSIDTALLCLPPFAGMLKTATFKKDKMLKAVENGFVNATDCADYLVKKGMAFRDAYKIAGQLVSHCVENQTTLETLPLGIFQQYSELFDVDVFKAIDLNTCVNKRNSEGGPSKQSVKAQLDLFKALIKTWN